MGGCPALTAAEHLCSSGGIRDAVSSTAFHSGGGCCYSRGMSRFFAKSTNTRRALDSLSLSYKSCSLKW